jgi:metal-dependent amidase/aminoacylase/carboxypeptidase family protein
MAQGPILNMGREQTESEVSSELLSRRERVLASISGSRSEIEETVAFVHAHPELAHEERECSRFLAGRLEAAGFEVELGIAGLETAFRASLKGGDDGPSVGIVDLYDAVPAVREAGRLEAVHSCGHGPIAGGVEAAARALAGVRDDLRGSVEIIGCPADELHAPGTRRLGGGKALTAEAGIWDGIDAALYAHPEYNDTVTLRSRWMRRLVARAESPRTMDALCEFPRQAAADALRAVDGERSDRLMIESMLIDGDVEEGSGLGVRADFFLTTDSEAELDELDRDLRRRLPGVEWTEARTVPGIEPDDRVRSAVARAVAASGREFLEEPPPLPFATDFGNISRRVPSALIGIGRTGGWQFHTDQGAAEFASEDGIVAAIGTAEVLALTVLDLIGSK